ncbi:hypothetical protein EV363DRAFT_1418649 [Boletus edulis]|nr:hypothetical protein EV363DRAFT_1418649 [Boletus edulis]
MFRPSYAYCREIKGTMVRPRYQMNIATNMAACPALHLPGGHPQPHFQLLAVKLHLMSTKLQSTLELLVLTNYMSLVIVTAVVYDHGLLDSVLYLNQYNRSRQYLHTWSSGSSVIFRLSTWTFVVFLFATDLVMILRVFAMWNQSRMILYILLTIYVPQIISTVVFYGIYENPDAHSSVRVVRVVDFSFCNTSFANFPRLVTVSIVVPRFVLATTLMILAVFQTLKQSVRMYKATKQWRPNRYMQQLVSDGIIYFVVNVFYHITGLLALVSNNDSLFLDAFSYIIFYPLIPRFIISIRELYDRDIHGRLHIDTGFGVQLRSNVGLDTTVSAMVFADESQAREVEGDTGDLETGRNVHGSGLVEDASLGGMD